MKITKRQLRKMIAEALDLDLEVEKAREDLKSFGFGGDDNSAGE